MLAHSLGALGIQIQAARSVLHKDADQASDLLAAAQQMAAEGLVETRRAVQALRTDTLPLNEELALVTDTHAQRYHVPVSYDTGGIPAALPPDATLALLRIAQEALVNAAKHAAGASVDVRVAEEERHLVFSVCDDGPGFDPEQRRPGSGLGNMVDRVAALRGSLEVTSAPGGGTRVTGRIPLDGMDNA